MTEAKRSELLDAVSREAVRWGIRHRRARGERTHVVAIDLEGRPPITAEAHCLSAALFALARAAFVMESRRKNRVSLPIEPKAAP